MRKIVIIGGNAAGLTAASRAKRLDPQLDITVLERLPQIAYSTCGLPYMLGKVVAAESLISYTTESFERERGIKVQSQVHVHAILTGRKRVEAVRMDTEERVEFPFDRLLIATGVKPRFPDIPGVTLGNVLTIISLQDALRAQEPVAAASHVAIVGAGYSALEFAEN